MKKKNHFIFYLMISDIFVITGFGLADPILAIFIKEDLARGTIFSAGVASAIFLITKSLTQLPFSKHVDTHDDADDAKWLLYGTILITTVPFIYIFATDITHIFIAQFIHGIGSGLAFSTWLGLWSTHLDKKKESFEWSMYSTVVSIGTAIAAAIGAAIAEYTGFTWTFLAAGFMSLVGCMILFRFRRRVSLVTNK